MTNHRGFTLLEVLISLFLLSLMLLGVMAAQVVSLREARGLYYFQQAMMLAENMVEYLAAHGGVAAGYQRRWQQDIALGLPVASGEVTRAFPVYRIVVQWGSDGKSCHQNHAGVSGCAVINHMM